MKTITDVLKKMIANCGISDKRLGELAGVNRNSIARFMRGDTGLSLDQAENLALFFGLELKPARRSAGRKGRK
ncbi:MAG TPA: XRE family transcriptional regulator [Candidatus Hydrogenedentes bacterium]|nr:XRE family transcriptional regulator [Candidatus Hydrogenedentota bacterium]